MESWDQHIAALVSCVFLTTSIGFHNLIQIIMNEKILRKLFEILVQILICPHNSLCHWLETLNNLYTGFPLVIIQS